MTQPSAHTRIEGLDVLRGIAVALVLLRHAWPDVFGGAGIVGVVMFFTLSGYLITGILVRDIERFGKVRYGRFYRNRALRLIPALLLVTGAIALVAAIWDLLDDRQEILRTVLVAITYTADIPFEHGSPAIDHLWTLAVEEQFYIVWPLVLVLGFKLRRVRGTVLVIGILIELVAIAMVVYVAPVWAKLYTLPFAWIIAMVIGAGLQLALHRYGMRWLSGRWRVAAIGVAIAVLALTSLYPELKNTFWVYVAGAPIIAVATAVLLVEMKTWLRVPSPIWRPVLALGTVSYAAYLWNYPIALWLEATIGSPWAGPVSIGLTVVAAAASWYTVEHWALVWKASLERRADPRGAQEKVAQIS